MTNEELCGQIRGGVLSAQNKLWGQTERLFYAIARSVYTRQRERAVSCGVEIADCLQVCWFAFLDAVESYNRKPGQDAKFKSYAGFHIRRHIYALLGLRTSKREPLNEADSLDATMHSDKSEYSLADTVADETAEAPFDEVVSTDVGREVLERVATLSDNRRGIITRYFWEGRTLSDIAKSDGTTPSNVHNLYRDALRKLRRDERLRQIHDEFYANANFTKYVGYQTFRESGMSSVEWHLLKLEERLGRLRGGGAGNN